MVVFRINRRSGVATYLQIVQQVEQALRMGALAEGDRLPTAAQVAADTKVNPNTTLKAYRELERAGLAEVRQGAGTFITRTLAPAQEGPESPLRAALAAWMEEARARGLDAEEVTALFLAAHAAAFPSGPDG
ncbi:GntR family transcriptional regulator [Kitasatospora sp. NPDC056327]|uniref:GntR family transcriptional regulator n=1 Tax=Kitasatospora sp. NPDC056327 TaxID=3345785 RepID=UPI0035E36291